ncbi:hypothetical protein BH23GEM7_BH23GEM7_39810 [soil metagenome]
MADHPLVPASREREVLPERRLTSTEMEAVIHRAVELQAREVERGVGEGITEAELVRIGKELGLSPLHMQQALAEVQSRAPEKDLLFGRGFGDSRAVASRMIRRSADQVTHELDAYLRDRECMVVQRRMPARTIYTQASGVVAAFSRAASRVGSRHELLKVKTLEVSVQPVDESACYVAVGVDLTGQRTGLAAGGLVGGSGAGAAVGIIFAIAIAPAAALVGVPVVIGSILGVRTIYRYAAAQMHEKLESLLDRLEHRELLPPTRNPRGTRP